MIMNLYKEFKEKIIYDLKKTMKKDNIHQVPLIDKVIVTMWIWSLATRKWVKDFSELENHLATITWQKPYIIKSKKAISNFKLREWMPVMIKVTLRKQKAYDFIDRLVKLVLPRLRDFSWLNPRKFDWKWNYNIWFQNQAVFTELNPEEINTNQGIQVNISTTSSNNEDAKLLLESLWVIFLKK